MDNATDCACGVRDDVIREALRRGVVDLYRVVERLACKRNFVLGAGQFFLELHHVFIRLEIGISFRQGEQPAKRSRQRTFRLPPDANAEKIKASYSDGVLTLSIPRFEPEKPSARKIEIGKG